MEERQAEQEQEPERGDEHRHRMVHDPAREAGPGALSVRRHGHLANREGVQARSEDREHRRQQGQGRQHGEEHDDRPGHPDRAQDHELEQHEPDEPEQDGQATEEHGSPGRCHGRLDGRADDRLPRRPTLGSRRNSLEIDRTAGQLLAESAGEQQRVVHAQAESQQRGEVQHEDAHRGQAGKAVDHGQRGNDCGSADGQRHRRGHQRAEHDDQRQAGQWQRDQLAPPQVGLRHALDVAVEGRPTGQLDVEIGRMAEEGLEDRQDVGRVVGGEVEEEDVIRGVAIGRDLAFRQQVRQLADDVRRGGKPGRGSRGGCLEGRGSRQQRVAVVDDGDRRRRRAELLSEGRSGARRFERIEAEAAGLEGAAGARCERDREQDQDRPGGHDPPAAPVHESPEALKRTHARGSVAEPARMAGRRGVGVRRPDAGVCGRGVETGDIAPSS